MCQAHNDILWFDNVIFWFEIFLTNMISVLIPLFEIAGNARQNKYQNNII